MVSVLSWRVFLSSVADYQLLAMGGVTPYASRLAVHPAAGAPAWWAWQPHPTPPLSFSLEPAELAPLQQPLSFSIEPAELAPLQLPLQANVSKTGVDLRSAPVHASCIMHHASCIATCPVTPMHGREGKLNGSCWHCR